MGLRIQVDQQKIADFCRRHHVRHLAFFGSVTREDFRPDIDVDVLVEFETGKTPGFGFIAMERELSAILGRKVDLQTPGFLDRRFRAQVQAEAVDAYVEA